MLKEVHHTVMHSYPGLVALITAASGTKRSLMAAGWHSWISYEPPIFGISVAPERYTHHIMEEAGSFAVQFLPAGCESVIQTAGSFSSSETDKFTLTGVETFTGHLGHPILSDAYTAYECRTIHQHSFGDHDWFAADILHFYRRDAQFRADGLPEFSHASLPLYLGRSTYLRAGTSSETVQHRFR
ncbi:flavin reductase family protein [Alkalicoccus chagannorensis]|uniref:flavin reductase family protein n=1 Tax=Alkalicoccus chagannorensis TaxID=427072 RepID=UPI0004284095|nr:flavin reductase family protein [Alkalicoccus chagannorensis]